MARPKKDSSIRQKEFIIAAKSLFFTKGYEDTSIKDILDKVGDRSISPSVFYYYFDSKEDIYHRVMEDYIDDYLDDLEKLIFDDSIDLQDRIIGAMNIFIKTLEDSDIAINKRNTKDNYLFILDLQDRIKMRIIKLCRFCLDELNWIEPDCIESFTQFITGGSCELIYDFVFSDEPIFKDIKNLTMHIVSYTMTILKVPKDIEKLFIEKLNNL